MRGCSCSKQHKRIYDKRHAVISASWCCVDISTFYEGSRERSWRERGVRNRHNEFREWLQDFLRSENQIGSSTSRYRRSEIRRKRIYFLLYIGNTFERL